MKKVLLVFTVLVVALGLMACGSNEVSGNLTKVNIGYFPNIAHAPAMVGIENGYFEKELEGLDVSTVNFPNGSLFMDALATEQIDIGYVGPGPAINRYLQGGDVVLISNASIGENVLVLRNDIPYNGVEDLEGKLIATASTGCTHDLLLRKMLQESGMAVEENGGTVKRIAQKPSTNLSMLYQKQIDGALVSEPWASLMEAEGVGRVVVDVTEQPWDGKVPAAVVVVRKEFLETYPEVVEQFLKAHEDSINFINENRTETVKIIESQIKAITGEEIAKDIIDKSLNRVFFTTEIDEVVLQEFADLSKDLGFIKGDSNIKNFLMQKLGR